ncbi:MAG: hypothetical protein R2939_21110 [Kofleriaceae bacterium]
MRHLLLLAGTAAAIAGCDGPDDRPTTWAYLHATIIEPGCATAGCHSRLSNQGGLNLASAKTAHAQLTGRVRRAGAARRAAGQLRGALRAGAQPPALPPARRRDRRDAAGSAAARRGDRAGRALDPRGGPVQ